MKRKKNVRRAWMSVFLALPLCLVGCSNAGEEEVDVHNPPPKSFRVLVSGEELVAYGIPFRHGGDSVEFEDGWKLSFESAIVTLAQVHISENPDMSPGDPSMTGPVVAELEGPFAVELKRRWGSDADENEGEDAHGLEQALGVLTKQNRKKGSPAFDAQTRYAFGYSLVRATPEAVQLGFDEEAQKNYKTMEEHNYSVFVRGRAWREESEECVSSDATAASLDALERLPEAFEFELGFDMPVDYKNCENPHIGRRGIQVKDNASVDAVISLHFDHLFWEALEEDAKLRLDAWVAKKSMETGPVVVRNEDLANLTYACIADEHDTPLPFRSCGKPQTGGHKEGCLRYEPGNEGGGLFTLDAFIQHNLSSFGHLNENGLCYPERRY